MARREETMFASPLPVYKTNEWMLDIHTCFTEDKAAFIEFSDKYADPYGTALLAKINASKDATPDALEIDVIAELTATLESKMDRARIELQKLFNFVVDVFPHNKAKLNQAGKNDYESARKVPEKMMTLLDMAKIFADANAVALTAKGYSEEMASALSGLKDEIQTALKAQNIKQKDRPVKTQDRRKIANEAYIAVRDLCEDAKILYVNDNAKYNRYLLPGEDAGTVISGTVNGGETVNILRRDFEPEDSYSLKNTSSAELLFCLAPEETTGCLTGVTVAAHSTVTVTAAQLGDTGYFYMNVTNKSVASEGSYEVQVL